MANTTQDTLYDTFLILAADLGRTSAPMIQASQDLANSANTVSNALNSSAATWDRLTPIPQSAIPGSVAGPATAGSAQDTPIIPDVLSSISGEIPLANLALSGSGSSGKAGGTMETIASMVLKSGFGAIPLVGSLLGLFGGNNSDTPPPLVKYALAPSLQFQAGQSELGIANSDYDQMGMPRAYRSSGIRSKWRIRQPGIFGQRARSTDYGERERHGC